MSKLTKLEDYISELCINYGYAKKKHIVNNSVKVVSASIPRSQIRQYVLCLIAFYDINNHDGNDGDGNNQLCLAIIYIFAFRII